MRIKSRVTVIWASLVFGISVPKTLVICPEDAQNTDCFNVAFKYLTGGEEQGCKSQIFRLNSAEICDNFIVGQFYRACCTERNPLAIKNTLKKRGKWELVTALYHC